MNRLTVLAGGVVVGGAAWLGAADTLDDPQAPVLLAMAQPATRDRPVTRADLRQLPALDPDMIEQCMEVAREVDPILADSLQRIRRDRSERDFRLAMGNARHLVGLVALKEQNPQLYDVKVKELRLQARVDHLLQQLIAARREGSLSTPDLEKQLERMVNEQVGYSLVARGMYLLRLKQHVKALRDELDHDLQPASLRAARQIRYQELLDRVEEAVVGSAVRTTD
jgi:hypothetical protein